MRDHFQAAWIGQGVEEIRELPAPLTIAGNTSKGMFLKHPSRKVIFLSREAVRGPFSVILNRQFTPSICEDAEVRLGNDLIEFSSGCSISLSTASVWNPSALSTGAVPSIGSQMIREIHQYAIAGGKADTLLTLFTARADLESARTNTSPPDYMEKYKPVMLGLGIDPIEQQIKRLSELIGYGRGLTPSGDDFLCGLALGLTRYHITHPRIPIAKQFSENLLPLAYEKTTLISANILEYSLRGITDERVLAGLDGLISGNLTAKEIASLLSGWGSSSGFDTLAGLLCLLAAVGNLQD